jgi:hypothetical protein
VKIVAGVPAPGRLRAKVGPEPGGEVRARRLAGDRAKAQKAGRIAIELELPAKFRHLAHTPEGVYGVARVSFRHPGRRTLRGKVQVRFHTHRKSGRRR